MKTFVFIAALFISTLLSALPPELVIITKAEFKQLTTERLFEYIRSFNPDHNCSQIKFKVARVTSSGSYQDIIDDFQNEISPEVKAVIEKTSAGDRVQFESISCFDENGNKIEGGGNKKYIRNVDFLITE